MFKKIANYPAYITFGLDRPAILATWYRNIMLYGLVAIGATTGIVMALGFALRRAREERRAVARWQAETPAARENPGTALSEPEDGEPGEADRRHRARLQQSAHRDRRQCQHGRTLRRRS